MLPFLEGESLKNSEVYEISLINTEYDLSFINNCIGAARSALRGVGYEPEARAGLNPEPGTDHFS